MNKQEQIINNDVMPYTQPIDTNIEHKAQYCNMCGKEFDLWDTQENFKFNHWFGFGSSFDLTHLEFHVCCNCADKILSDILLKLQTIDKAEEYSVFGNDTTQLSLDDVKDIAKTVIYSNTDCSDIIKN